MCKIVSESFIRFQASAVMGEEGEEAGGDAKAEEPGESGGLADMAESIVEAVENATTEIFNATQVNRVVDFTWTR